MWHRFKPLIYLSCLFLSPVVWAEDTTERYEGELPGDCSDDADNDRDGLFDCNDPGCKGAGACAEDTPVAPPEPAPAPAEAETVAEPEAEKSEDKMNIAIYAEWTTLLFANAGGINAEVRPVKKFALSAGLGTGGDILGAVTANGGRLQAHMLQGSDNHLFELAGGISIFSRVETEINLFGSSDHICDNAEDDDGDGLVDSDDSDCEDYTAPEPRTTTTQEAAPTFFVGYRYQRPQGGLLFRVGFGYTYLMPGMSISMGGSF